VAPDTPLKLRAEDTDDLAVISGLVQDALIAVKDLTYDRAARSFTLVANRFRWESPADKSNGAAAFERTLCAVTFAEVDKVRYRGFRRAADDGRILSLLAIRPGDDGGVGATAIDLEFSGDAAVRLAVAAIRVHATDVGEPWPTAWQPDHEEGERKVGDPP
jgi:Protein of unknown function (DUF2948)